MLKYPNINPVIFEIGPFAPRWYGLVYLSGFLYLYYWMRREWKWLGMKDTEQVDSVLGMLIFCMIFGARVAYVLFYNFSSYLQGPWWEIFAVWHGGLSFHGAVAGIMIGSVWICRLYKIQLFRVWDILFLSAPLALGFGRIANFINGELWGRVTDVPLAMVFPGAGPEPRHPSQFYEAFTEGFLFYFVVLFLWKRKYRHGVISGVFGIWYAISRTFCELYREPDRQVGFLWGGITMGQLLSFVLFFAGVVLLTVALRREVGEDEMRALEARGKRS